MKKFLLIFVIYILNFIFYNRSFSSTLTEFLIKVLDLNVKFKGDKEDVLKKIEEAKFQEYGKDKVPYFIKLFTRTQEIKIENLPCLCLNRKSTPKHIIFYIHGGGYIEGLGIFQLLMLYRVSKMTNAMVLIPKYPLIPNTHEKSYHILTSIYKKILENYSSVKIIMMGDSAGGGLTLGLVEQFKYYNIKQPHKVILLSPYVDTSFSSESIKYYEKIDPMLSVIQAKELGKYWAGNLRDTHFRISPINGRLDHLTNVYIFVGNREIMFPDNIKLFNKLQNNKVNVKLYIGRGQNHVYPAIPNLEGCIAVAQISKIINYE